MAIYLYLYLLLATLPEEGRELTATERQHFETQLEERSSHPKECLIEFQHIPLQSRSLSNIRFTEVSLRLAKVNAAERSSIDRFNNRLFSDDLLARQLAHGRYGGGESTVIWNRRKLRHDVFTTDRTKRLTSYVFNGAVWVHKQPKHGSMKIVTIGGSSGQTERSSFFPLTKDSRSWRLLNSYRPKLVVDGDQLIASFTFSQGHSSELLFTWPECRLSQATHFNETKVRTATFWLRDSASGGVAPDAIYDLRFNHNERLIDGRILLIQTSTTEVELGAADFAVAADIGTTLFDYTQGGIAKGQLLQQQTPNVLQLNVNSVFKDTKR